MALVHPDGSSTLVAWPVRLRGTDADAEPTSRRCERISQGAPYVGSDAKGLAKRPNLDASVTTSLQTFERQGIAHQDPCAAAFGSSWRLPTLDEFNSYAPHLLKAGDWLVRRPSGSLHVVDYAPPIKLRLARGVEIPARSRPSLTDTGRVVCLRESSASAEPSEPSREEVERCVRQFFASTADLAALVAVRVACQQDAPLADWLRILDDLEQKLGSLAETLIDPSKLEAEVDESVEDFAVGLLQTVRVCLERPLHSSGRTNGAAVDRLDELQAILDAAHEQRLELRQRQRAVEHWRSAPPMNPLPFHETAPKPWRCGCPQGDLACSMRCAAKGQ